MGEETMMAPEKRNTSQKMAIKEALEKMHNHPTATMVAEELAKDGNKASRATVFRVLSNAADEGLIGRVQISQEDVRYDGNPVRHYHMHCRICGKIVDCHLPYMENLNALASEDGFKAESNDIEFTGICADCQKKIKSKKKLDS